MKRMLSFIFIFLPFAFNSVFANTHPAAEFDETEIYAAFDAVTELEARVLAGDEVTFSGLKTENSGLVENVVSNSALAINMNTSLQSPPILPAFFWGCVAGVTGIVLVAVTTGNDEAQVKNAFYGCIAQSVSFSVLWALVLIVGYSM